MKNKKIIENALTSEEAKRLQGIYGKNEIVDKTKNSFLNKIFHILCEPMFLLLIIASIIYFILGEPVDAFIMLIFVVVVISIDIFQEWKTDKTLETLKELSAPHVSVIRDGKEIIIASNDLVPGDVMIITEGIKISADGFVLSCKDLCVDESSLTGETIGVWKVTNYDIINTDDYWKKNYVYAGTLVTQGSAYILIDKIGLETEYGKISANVAKAPDEPTPLQKQINKIVKVCAIIAGVLFLLVVIVTYFNLLYLPLKDRIIKSILSALSLAMAMIPEEFPVILTVFLSMGAWRLAKKQSLVKRLPSVETLGSVSVLCVDKTGTITKNQMSVDTVWSLEKDENELVKIMGMACEINAYDSMEKAMLEYYNKLGISTDEIFSNELIDNYPFTNKLKMMGHIYKTKNQIILAAKGATESILKICNITKEEKKKIDKQIEMMSSKGIRVIAVGKQKFKSKNEIPAQITDCNLNFCGLIGLVDPPRESIKKDIEICNKAGIRVVMITGDNGITAKAIAKQVGIQNCDNIITGNELDKMSDDDLKVCINNTNIFSRVIPEHKMRIVKAFKENGEIVAMTGDGVNDAPALKYADIGIAMGKSGSEVSREAADLILLDDNFSTIVHTIKDGRRIYDNIRKAIGYVFTIHIPIAFSSLLAPLFNIDPASLLFLPIHVVLLELFIDPTCSVILERQPAESNIMTRKPRKLKDNVLNKTTLIKSIFQGLAIFISSFGTYYIVLNKFPTNPNLARTLGISILLLSNLFLVHVNNSSIDSVIQTFKQLIHDKVMWAINLITIFIIIIMVYTPINKFLKLTTLTFNQFVYMVIISIISVFWYEILKILKRKK